MKENKGVHCEEQSEIGSISEDVDTTDATERAAEKFMYKDVLREIYMDVKYQSDKKDSKDSERFPRVIDYAREVLNYFKARNENILRNAEKIDDPKRIEREVGYALESLRIEGVLGKIGTKYVPKAQALEHEGRAYLLKYLHLQDGQLLAEKNQTLIFPLVKFKRKHSPSSNTAPLNNELNESQDDVDVQKTNPSQMTREKPLSDIENLQQELSMIKEQMLNSSKEIEELKEKVAGLDEERRIRDRIHNLKVNLKKFIGLEYCAWVFEVDNNIVVLLDGDDEKILCKILDKLAFLLKEINENKAKAKAAAAKKAKAAKRKSRKNKG